MLAIATKSLYEILYIFGYSFDFGYTFKLLILMLLIYKPTAIFIKLILAQLPISSDDSAIDNKNTDEIIGILEKLTIVFVITAKSITQFK